jgi:pimeloyl-ACP methyl ester carboxylesterase
MALGHRPWSHSGKSPRDLTVRSYPLNEGREGTPVFLLPSLGGSGSLWQETADAMTHPAIAIEASGFGNRRNPRASCSVTLEDSARTAAYSSAFANLDGPIAVYGHSAGAMLAIRLAKELRGRGIDVVALGLVNGLFDDATGIGRHPLSGGLRHPGVTLNLLKLLIILQTPRPAWIKERLTRPASGLVSNLYSPLTADPRRLSQASLEYLVGDGHCPGTLSLLLANRELNFSDLAALVEQDLHLVLGDTDPLCNSQGNSEFLELLRDAGRGFLPHQLRCGHITPLEQPVELAKLIDEHVDLYSRH